jgi:GDP-mannose transporter
MFCDEEMDLEEGKLLKSKDNKILVGTVRVNQAFLSGLAYCLSSCSMILVNKFVLSGYDFSAGISLMLYQVSFSCIFFISCKKCKL